MSERLDERLRRAARTYRRLGNHTAEGMFLEAADTICELQTDNAKLRELVRDVYKAFMHGNCYRWCEFKEPCNYISDGKCQWYDRMRELGVTE